MPLKERKSESGWDMVNARPVHDQLGDNINDTYALVPQRWFRVRWLWRMDQFQCLLAFRERTCRKVESRRMRLGQMTCVAFK